MSPEALIDRVHNISPSAIDTWGRCRREYLLASVLRVPKANAGPGPELGNFAHDLLRHVHRTGSCHDEAHVADVLTGLGKPGDRVALGYVDRHRRRCPTNPEHGTHEWTAARFHAAAMFVATGRLDAVWRHDGIYDVRDYKTGRPAVERLADDPRARVQAWLVADRAARRGLRVHVRYEYLAPEVDEDPEPFEPDADDLAAIESELVATVGAMRAEQEWRGIADPDVCRLCGYRSICADSAAPSEPTWPTP